MDASINPLMSNKKAFSITQTVQQFGAKLMGFIRGKVGSEADAEDILQDVWFQFSRLANVEDIENISGWLYRVARNKITDKQRKQTTDSLENFSNEEDDWNLNDILLLDPAGNPELAMFKELFWEELIIALKELPENQRAVFVLNEMEDFSLQQIADQTGENIKTIISRKNYAIKHLRKKLNHLYQELNN